MTGTCTPPFVSSVLFSKILSKNTLYRDECFMKIGTPVEPIKVRGSTTFDRLGNAKLKRKKKKKKKLYTKHPVNDTTTLMIHLLAYYHAPILTPSPVRATSAPLVSPSSCAPVPVTGSSPTKVTSTIFPMSKNMPFMKALPKRIWTHQKGT